MASELQALSVILVFISVAFSLVMPAAWEELNTSMTNYPKSDAAARSNKLSEVRGLWLFQVAPVTVLCLIVAYLCTPRAVSIACSSRLDLWEFAPMDVRSVHARMCPCTLECDRSEPEQIRQIGQCIRLASLEVKDTSLLIFTDVIAVPSLLP